MKYFPLNSRDLTPESDGLVSEGEWENGSGGFCRFDLLFMAERLQLVLSSGSAA